MGERFGNYELIEKIAAGGMAEIFLARSVHAGGIEKRIVIKRIHPVLAVDRTFVAMFIDEARLGVTMVHGNIVPIFDFGCVDGYYYLAMEHVQGQNLGDLTARAKIVGRSWPFELALFVIIEVLEGLAYAHGKRDDEGKPLELVHRDVSPSNVLVSYDGQVKLLDFGIARSHAREFETRTGVVKGKPDYMSPEQAAGTGVDARADLWSVGVVLHELVTGRKLRDGRRSVDDEDLAAVLDTSLAQEPEDRYTSARDMQEALSRILIDRGWHPRAGDLADFIEDIWDASATGGDWHMHSADVKQRLAQAVTTMESDSSLRSESEDDEEIEEGTRQLPAPDSRLRRFVAIGLLLLVGIVGVGAATWIATRPPLEHSPAQPPRPVARQSGPPDSGPADPDGDVAAMTPPLPSAADTGPRDATPAAPTAPSKRAASQRRRTPKRRGRARSSELSPAYLSVNTEPWTRVYLDGTLLGTTPLLELEISPGAHEIRLVNPVRNLEETRKLEARAGQHARISVVLGSAGE